jgi:Protein of unknown function (DUF2934)
MDRNLNDRIRERAYQIWFANGCRDGEAEQHWLTAEREILQPATAAIAAKRTSAKKVSRPLARATPKVRPAN